MLSRSISELVIGFLWSIKDARSGHGVNREECRTCEYRVVRSFGVLAGRIIPIEGDAAEQDGERPAKLQEL